MAEHSNPAWRAFLDIILISVVGLAIIIVLLLILIVVPKETDPVPAPGAVVVEVHWKERDDIDIDLWVLGPDKKPVGYANRHSPTFNLLRDDLGNDSDASCLDNGPCVNNEFASSHGAPAGHYIINLHVFADDRESPTYPYSVFVGVYVIINDIRTKVFSGPILLDRVRDEKTVVHFDLDDRGLVKNSVHHVQTSVRPETRSHP